VITNHVQLQFWQDVA